MSLLLIESFYAFGTYNGSDAFDAAPGAANAARAANAANLARAGYPVFVPSNATADTSGGWLVRPDGVDPDMHALTHSSAVAPTVSLGVSAAFKKKLTLTDKQIIIGFGIFVPVEYVPNNSSSTVPVFRMNANVDSDVNWQAVGITPLNTAKECFRIANDLSIRWGTDAAQSSKKLNVGALNYMEVRIDTGNVSVWIDDTFVMQKSVSLIPQSVAFIFENNINANPLGTNMSGNPGRWALSNMYFMVNDGILPTVRLGPTTRVVGQRPDTDIDVRFIRPASAATNAEVAGQDLVDTPPKQLQSTTVGDYDTYQTVNAVTNAKVKSLAMVHAVGIKVLASNLEPDVHKIKPYAKFENSGEGADAKTKEFALMTGMPWGTRTIRNMGVRPTDNCIFVIGDGEMIYRSGPNFDVSNWTRIIDTGTARSFWSMWFRADGSVLFGGPATNPALSGPLNWLPAGSDVLGANGNGTQAPGAAAIVLSPDGSKLVAFQGSGQGGRWTNVNTAPGSANPSTGTWTLTAPTGVDPTNNTGFVDAKLRPDNGLVMALQAGACDYVYINSTPAMTAYTARAHGDTGVAYTAMTHDGTAWLIGASSNDSALGGAPRIRRSTDANSFGAVTPLGSMNAGANQVLRRGASNIATQESIFVGDAGSMVMSMDGINWRQLPRLTTSALYAAVAMDNGDFLVAGAGGVMLRTVSPGTDTALQPLAGYTMTFGAAALNPKTGNPWTPEEAATAYFGVRLTT